MHANKQANMHVRMRAHTHTYQYLCSTIITTTTMIMMRVVAAVGPPTTRPMILDVPEEVTVVLVVAR